MPRDFTPAHMTVVNSRGFKLFVLPAHDDPRFVIEFCIIHYRARHVANVHGFAFAR